GKDRVRVRVVDRVNCLAFIQDELPRTLRKLCNLNIVVQRLLLIDEVRDLFERPQREYKCDKDNGERGTPERTQDREKGGEKKRMVIRRELKNILTETCSSTVTDQARTRSLINGSSAVESAATAVMTQRTCADG